MHACPGRQAEGWRAGIRPVARLAERYRAGPTTWTVTGGGAGRRALSTGMTWAWYEGRRGGDGDDEVSHAP